MLKQPRSTSTDAKVRGGNETANEPEPQHDLDRIISTEQRALNWLTGWSKAILDVTLALLLLIPALPLMILAGLLVRLTSRGPACYWQLRLGLRGKPYWIYKIRTMYQNAEEAGAQWSLPRDPRVTPVGRILRHTHIDELPQLWNILRREMSLVGPRPERPEIVPALAEAVPGYSDRLTVLPGVTGLAQVQLAPDTHLESVQRKVLYDRWYMQHAGFWLDLRLVLCTGLRFFGVPYCLLSWVLRIPGADKVEGGKWKPGMEVQAGANVQTIR
jgi:lipopolysaccharide/colanic/teichoic acid biosynthesis glycosyltransferase